MEENEIMEGEGSEEKKVELSETGYQKTDRDAILNSLYDDDDEELLALERSIMDGSLFKEEKKSVDKKVEKEEVEEEQEENEEEEDDDTSSTNVEEEEDTLSSVLAKKRKADEERLAAEAIVKKEMEQERKRMELEARERAILDYNEKLMNNNLKSQSASANEDHDSFKAFSKDLLEGEDEKAADKLKDGVGRLLKDKVAPVEDRLAKIESDFERRVEETARRIDLERQWESALEDFSTKRSDIAGDEILSNLFNSNLKLAAENGISPRKAVQLAEKEIDNWINKRFGKRVEQKEEKVSAKKDTAKKYSVKSSGVSKNEPKHDVEYEEVSAASIIAEMARERSRK